MRKFFVILAMFGAAAAAVTAGCDGGGGGSSYNFNGTWMLTERVVESNHPEFPVGGMGMETVIITQDGTSIVVRTPGEPTGLPGTCDPKAKTFRIDLAAGSNRFVMTGVGVSRDSISGEIQFYQGNRSARVTYTGDLQSRSTAGSATEREGIVGRFLEGAAPGK